MFFLCVSKGISPVKSFRAVFALLMLFLYVILHIMWSGKSLQLLFILAFVVLVCINMIFVKSMLAACMLVGVVV